MNRLTLAAIGLSTVAIAAATVGIFRVPTGLTCVEASSTGNQPCQDSGNFPGTCAVATCPEGYTLTGGGGICAAGNIKVKGLNPRLSTGEFFIMCEQQGVNPQARAICCKV
jgi:hypothetical protein